MANSPKKELKRFLDEDVGKGDITSKLLQKKKIKARIITRERTIVAGSKYAKEIFSLKKCKVVIKKKDGVIAKPNQTMDQFHDQVLLASKMKANPTSTLFA